VIRAASVFPGAPTGAFVICAVASVAFGTARPPSSVEPETRARPVRVSHHHQRVKACDLAKARTGAHCVASLEEASSSATVVFQSILYPSTTDDDARHRVTLKLSDRIGRQEDRIELPLGRWLVDWLGYPAVRRLSVDRRSSPSILLETTSGRCSLEGNRCRMQRETVSRRLRVRDAK
jgi:hypothetical protein